MMYSNSTRVTVTVTRVSEQTIMVMNCSYYMSRNGSQGRPHLETFGQENSACSDMPPPPPPPSAPPSRLFTITIIIFFFFVVVIFYPLSFPPLTHTPSHCSMSNAHSLKTRSSVPAFQRSSVPAYSTDRWTRSTVSIISFMND